MTRHASRTAADRPARRAGLGRTAGRVAGRAVRALGTLLLVACLLSFLGLAVGPHVLGYRTMTMLTGSMAPLIEPGDVVVAFPTPTAELEVGDIVSYRIPVEDHRVETHRAVAVVERPDGRIAIRTKGDANDGVDPWTAVVEDDEVYVTRHVVPVAGDVIRFLRQPWIQDYALWAAVAGALLLGLRRIWSDDHDAQDDQDARDDDAPVTASHAGSTAPRHRAPAPVAR